jgi:hypothetical protein
MAIVRFHDGPLKGSKIDCEGYHKEIDIPTMMKNAKTYYATYIDTMLRVISKGKEDILIYRLKKA